MEKSRIFTKHCNLWKHFCDALGNYGMIKHNLKTPYAVGFLLSLKDIIVVWKYYFVCVLLGFSQIFGRSLLWTTSWYMIFLYLNRHAITCYFKHMFHIKHVVIMKIIKLLFKFNHCYCILQLTHDRVSWYFLIERSGYNLFKSFLVTKLKASCTKCQL